MKKLLLPLLLTAVMIFAGSSMSKSFAQSTVYICYDVQFWEQNIPIKINGQEAFSMRCEPKKIGQFVIFTPSKIKCTLNSEGKAILSFDFKATIPTTGAVIPYSDEIHLTLSENSVHYIKMKPVMKGNKIVFEELSEKDGKKEFAAKKYSRNPDYTETKE